MTDTTANRSALRLIDLPHALFDAGQGRFGGAADDAALPARRQASLH